MKHKRCPNGYHIEKWADGLYHLYRNDFGIETCLDEFPTRDRAIVFAYQDRDNQRHYTENEN